MIKKQNEMIKERLQNSLLQEKVSGFETLLLSLKSDLKGLFADYMSLSEDAVSVFMEVTAEDAYEFTVKVKTLKLYDPGKMIPWNN